MLLSCLRNRQQVALRLRTLLHSGEGLTLAARLAKMVLDPLSIAHPLAALILGDRCLNLDLDRQVWEVFSVSHYFPAAFEEEISSSNAVLEGHCRTRRLHQWRMVITTVSIHASIDSVDQHCDKTQNQNSVRTVSPLPHSSSPSLLASPSPSSTWPVQDSHPPPCFPACASQSPD
jgi:hypothetical protein